MPRRRWWTREAEGGELVRELTAVVGTLAGSDETTLGKLIATVRALTR